MFRLPKLSVHFFLTVYAVIALLPFGIIVLNSFKTRSGIFGDPLSLPDSTTLSTAGYQTLFASTDFLLYIGNSTIITSVSLLFIIGLGACAAYGLLESKTTLSKWIWLLIIVGIMIPLRLGTVGLLELMKSLNLLNSLIGLICIYIAQGLPLAVFIYSEVFRRFPNELIASARMDGLGPAKTLFFIVMPLTRPTTATIAIFSLVPVWNDLWFPLIIAPDPSVRTITLGVQQFIGQFTVDWPAVLAALSIAMAPAFAIYALISRNFIRNLSAGSIKG